MQVVWFGPLYFWAFAGIAGAERMSEAIRRTTGCADVLTSAITNAQTQMLERQFHFEERKRRLAARGGPSSYASFGEFLRHA